MFKNSLLVTGALSLGFGDLVGVAVGFLGDFSWLLGWGALLHVPPSTTVVGGLSRVLKNGLLLTGTLSWDFGCLVGVAVRFLGDSSGLLDWGALSHVPPSASVVGG